MSILIEHVSSSSSSKRDLEERLINGVYENHYRGDQLSPWWNQGSSGKKL